MAAPVPPMDKPPKLVVVPEVLPPMLSAAPAPAPPPVQLETGASGAPVHPLAALLLIGVDNLWNLADWAVIDWVITIPLSFITVFGPSLLIQRLVRRNPWGRAALLALLLGALAAVPTSITGTPAGVAFLAWSGLNRLLGHTSPKPPVSR
jgi:hypothetical protein